MDENTRNKLLVAIIRGYANGLEEVHIAWIIASTKHIDPDAIEYISSWTPKHSEFNTGRFLFFKMGFRVGISRVMIGDFVGWLVEEFHDGK